MNRVVLDASALLALLNQEPGAETLTPELPSAAAISAVNLAEVHGKLVAHGLSPADAWKAKAALGPVRIALPFTSDHARIAGELVPPNARARPLVGRPGVPGARLGFEAPRIHGRSVLERAKNRPPHSRHPLSSGPRLAVG